MTLNKISVARTPGMQALPMAFVAVACGMAYAQEDRATEPVLEEIVVTAERREMSLQQMPTSATVLTADALAAQGVDNILEIQQAAPGIAINTYNRSTFINIRGVGIAQSAPTSNPGVAYYIDGMFIPHEQFIAQTFFDIESIEVLRGPQGTLTGQNSTGGAIYVRTPVPEIGNLFGYVDQTVASYDWYRSTGALNLPLGENLALRIAGVYDNRDSFTKNIGPSQSKPGSGEDLAVRVAMRYRPTDGATFDLRFEHFDRETDNNAIKNRNDQVTSDPFIIEEDAISFLNQDGYRTSLEARFDLAAGTQLRLLTSYLDFRNTDQADGDRTATALPVPPQLPTNSANTALFPGRVGFTNQDLKTWVSEVNLLSVDDKPLQWVVGAFYLEENSPVQVYRDNRNTQTFVQSNSSIETKLRNESASLFGQLEYRFTDTWAVDLGLRYSEDKQQYTRFIIPGPPPPGCFPCTTNLDSSEVTGRFGIKYFASDDVMWYGTFSRGYKAGGINLDPRLPNYDPETNKVVELGVKSMLAKRRLRFNGAVFYSDYDGIQLSALTAVGSTLLPNTLNAAPAEIMGAELELQGQFDALGFNLGVSVIDSEFKEDAMLTDSQTNTNRLVPKGSPVPFAPKVTLTAGVEYTFVTNFMSVTPRLQLSYMDEQLSTPFRYDATLVPSRTIADARVTMKPSDALRIEAFVTNLFDKAYIAAQVQDASSAKGGIIFGPPRQYGLRLRYDF
jgi:iron complex outermembrane receptor protein